MCVLDLDGYQLAVCFPRRGLVLTDLSHCREKKASFPAALETGLNESVITERVEQMNGGFL